MNGIRAFVGHSFLEEDSLIVSRFLSYFDQIAKLHPTFSWEHAESAEPKLLAAKVMALMEGKNTFIGICTKKERAVEASAFSKVFLEPTYLKARASDFQWKTSDWIIQEIGLAKGRNLEIVLLLEDGVRRPGGLQGDIEYVPFVRSAPEKSFGKILEMITALSPRAAVSFAAASEAKSSKPDEAALEPSDDKWKMPSLSWTREDYEHAAFHMILDGDAHGAALIEKAYLELPEATQGINRDTWVARIESLRVRLGSGGNFQRLEVLAKKHPESSEILQDFALALIKYRSFREAAEYLEAAAGLSSDQKEIVRLLGGAALQHANANDRDRLQQVILKLKMLVTSRPELEEQLLGSLRESAEQEKEHEAAIGVMERLIELNPGDISLRFDLAYAHSENGNDDLALRHYLLIPYNDRRQAAWNNIGVVYSQFKLNARAIDAFIKAEEMDNSLAMSNLANKLISVGMLKEAMAKCERALKIENYHKNVITSISRIHAIPDEETKKTDELIEKSEKKAEFYRLIGRAIAAVDSLGFCGRWTGPECPLEASVYEGKIRLHGQYETDESPFYTLGLPTLGRRVVRTTVEYVMTLRGRSFEGFVKRSKEGEVPSVASGLLGAGDTGVKVLMVLSENGREIRSMEDPQSATPRFYSMTQSDGA